MYVYYFILIPTAKAPKGFCKSVSRRQDATRAPADVSPCAFQVRGYLNLNVNPILATLLLPGHRKNTTHHSFRRSLEHTLAVNHETTT